ncbi:MAG: phosphate ABC transporter substrate-binding protein PstS family protein [Anaerolineae bacterium]|nr:phosphate ABC transporter substrate-binding protein PstS family protein [Anaerolineae bacterium]
MTVSTVGDQAKVNAATITATDVEASNGVIHVIDSIILPEIELPAVDPLSLTGNITSAGSSTVYPVTQRLADMFRNDGFAGSMEVASVGTGAGFERFCGPEETATDISNASRPIREAEVTACRDQGREPLEFYIGVDALAIVVNPTLTCVENLTLADLARIFSGEAKTWNEIVPACDATEIKLFSPGTDSGTFDYFVEEVFDEDAAKILNAPGIQLSENDNVLVEGVAGSEGGIGYFGYAYYPPNRDRIRALNVEGVEPNASTAESGEYPLSRPLFIYTTPTYLAERPQVAGFVNYYLTNVNDQLGTGDGQIAYFPVSSDALNLDRLEWLAASGQ